MYCRFEDYPTYQQREQIKSDALSEYVKTDCVKRKAKLTIDGVIFAHYWRAREDIEKAKQTQTKLRKIRGKKYYSGYILDIDHYTRHWLWANGDGQEPDVIEAIKDIYFYEAEHNKYMPKGSSYYLFDG